MFRVVAIVAHPTRPWVDAVVFFVGVFVRRCEIYWGVLIPLTAYFERRVNLHFDNRDVTGFQGRKPRPYGLATDWSKFREPARDCTKKTENTARIGRGLECLECLGRLSWKPGGKLSELGDRLMR